MAQLSTPKKALYGLLVAFVLVAGVEVGLRLLLGPPPPPVQVYSGRGPIDDYLMERDGKVYLPYQERTVGPFDVEHDGPRVAVLGGSSVHRGTPGLPNEREFAALLSDELGMPVVNFGNPAFDTYDHVAILQELPRGAFDVWVVYAGHNDFGNAFFHSRFSGAGGAVVARALRLAEHLQLFCQLRRLVQPPAAVDPTAPLPWEHLQTKDRILPEDPRRAVVLDYFERNLETIAWLAEQHGARLVLVAPISNLWAPPVDRQCLAEPCAFALWEAGMQIKEREERMPLLQRAIDVDPTMMRAPSVVPRTMARVARERGARFVDTGNELHVTPALFVDHMHLSAQGHAEVARILAPVVSQELER